MLDTVHISLLKWHGFYIGLLTICEGWFADGLIPTLKLKDRPQRVMRQVLSGELFA